MSLDTGMERCGEIRKSITEPTLIPLPEELTYVNFFNYLYQY